MRYIIDVSISLRIYLAIRGATVYTAEDTEMQI